MEELAPQSSFMFLVACNEAFGYSHEQALESDYVLLLSMLREYSFLVNQRNKEIRGSDEEEPDGEYVEVVDFATGKLKRVKKVKAV